MSDCLDELRNVVSWEAAHLRARTLLRLGEAAAAFEEVKADDDLEGDCRAEKLTLRAAALGRLGDSAGAQTAIEDAFVASISTALPEFEAEVLFYRALLAFIDGDLFAAARDASAAAEVAPGLFAGQQHVIPLRVSHARALELVGLTHGAAARYREQLKFAMRAAELARNGPDRWIDALALSNVAQLARDLEGEIDPRIGYDVAQRALAFPWTADLAAKENQIYDALGTAASLRGDNHGAFRWFRRASEAARTPEDRLDASLQRAVLAHELDQDVIAREELDYCFDLSERIDWRSADNDRRLLLLVLAQAYAPVDVQRARRAIDRYDGLEPAGTFGPSQFETRVTAVENFAAALVARYEGRPAVAIAALERAHAAWTQASFTWRAAHCALELAELGVLSSLGEAADAASTRPGSWLARRVAAISGRL